jgi:hypothetical protein
MYSRSHARIISIRLANRFGSVFKQLPSAHFAIVVFAFGQPELARNFRA